MSDKPANQKNGAQSYRDLLVWQKSMTLAKEIYKLTTEFPSEEKFGLISQMRRAAVSVPSNIAEGSLAEVDTQLTLAIELNFVSAERAKSCVDLIAELRRMLNGLRRAINGRTRTTRHTSLVTEH